MTSKRKIAIFQSDLNVGGIQKSLINFFHMIDVEHYEIDLYLFDDHTFFDQVIPKSIHVIRMNPFGKLYKIIPFSVVRRLKRKQFAVITKEYDLAIDFNSYWQECSVGATSVKAKRRVMWVHNDVTQKLKEDKKYRILWRAFKGKFFKFDQFIAVSAGIIPSFCTSARVPPERVQVISNFVNTDEIFRNAQEPILFSVDPSQYNFVSVGRLCHQKGYDLLIDNFTKVLQKRTDVHLYLIGDGPDRKKLDEQIRRNKAEDKITLLGNQKNPFPYEKQMDGFILTSRYEGQGIVIWEAKALGLSLFISKNLEKYNTGITGCEDIVSAMCAAQKREKNWDPLTEYNQRIRDEITVLFDAD
ncbi:MAG: glycosyltransferase [Clostridiales bacterium]|jgi:glycosyltransferase involved in cell wall biosynthesis|nr:glycosyltransferase [Clostridiales bacterium]MCI1961992.1 glycosyltransferase [Clostridiales bacterium]MCI2022275.1 glycosyltransferase [Clostridiales bacterium]MCI2026672.1 glycosyltransferase [Clostridiales bacterium]